MASTTTHTEAGGGHEVVAFVTVVATAVIAGSVAYLSVQGPNGVWTAIAVAISLAVAVFGLWSIRKSVKGERSRQELDKRISNTQDDFRALGRDAERSLADEDLLRDEQALRRTQVNLSDDQLDGREDEAKKKNDDLPARRDQPLRRRD